MRKIALLILVIVFLAGCTYIGPCLQEHRIPIDNENNLTPDDFQVYVEDVVRQKIKEQEAEIIYVCLDPEEAKGYVKVYDYKDGEFCKPGWRCNNRPSKEVQTRLVIPQAIAVYYTK